MRVIFLLSKSTVIINSTDMSEIGEGFEIFECFWWNPSLSQNLNMFWIVSSLHKLFRYLTFAFKSFPFVWMKIVKSIFVEAWFLSMPLNPLKLISLLFGALSRTNMTSKRLSPSFLQINFWSLSTVIHEFSCAPLTFFSTSWISSLTSTVIIKVLTKNPMQGSKASEGRTKQNQTIIRWQTSRKANPKNWF